MSYKIEFIPEAEQDFAKLDNSIRKQVAKKIDKFSINPYFGEALQDKFGMNLTGFYKIYVLDKRYRIVYRIIESSKIVEIWAIDKRDKKKVYKVLFSRIERTED
ncbi:type II toxin-antitoxin system RelE family toxin [Hippea alviniae]|uniref:type II toxin-antitoxin system RelE family toxin n=1 Tax=Hippea alviniae TaxID=1279027 RepID=UPI0003B4290C|nr:type II toxin-antitoxin system RelE/ParE family toxin [Hippea alviniae]